MTTNEIRKLAGLPSIEGGIPYQEPQKKRLIQYQMPKPLIVKDDFMPLVQFSLNIPDKMVAPHINDAQDYDLTEAVGEDMVNDLVALDLHDEEERPELRAFWKTWVKPYLVFKSYSRILASAGKNLTQFGLVTPREDTSTPITTEERAYLIGDIDKKASVNGNRMLRQLKSVEWTFDNETYERPDCYKRKKRFGIHAVNPDCEPKHRYRYE